LVSTEQRIRFPRQEKPLTRLKTYVIRETAEVALIVLGLVVASRFLRVPVWAWIGIPLGKAIVSTAAYWLFLRRTFQRHHATGPQALIGGTGVALTSLRPTGQIKIRSEIWRAQSADGSEILEGTSIRVVAVDGSVARVRPLD